MLSFFTTQRLSGELKSLGVGNSAGFSFSDCTLGLTSDKITLSLQYSLAFIIKLNTPTQQYCKDFYLGS